MLGCVGGRVEESGCSVMSLIELQEVRTEPAGGSQSHRACLSQVPPLATCPFLAGISVLDNQEVKGKTEAPVGSQVRPCF